MHVLMDFKHLYLFIPAASQRQSEQHCEQEIDEIKRGIESGNVAPDMSLIRFSDEAIDEQNHCIRVADEKVALATQAYDMVCNIILIKLCCILL